MSLKSINPKQTLAWKKLQAHFDTIKDEHMSKWFSNNPNRPVEMSVEWDDFYLDFSKNRITSETLSLLKDLVEEAEDNQSDEEWEDEEEQTFEDDEDEDIDEEEEN